MGNLFPQRGIGREPLFARMRELAREDADWRNGKTFSLVYYVDDELGEVLKQATSMFLCSNGLSPFAFPSLRQFEHDVVSMTAELLAGGPSTCGTMTSGGTESILMAVKAARDKAAAERPGVREPEMVLPITAHPAFEKAAHYLRVKPVHVPVGKDFRADVAAARAAITDNTVLVVGSAPAYPHGVVDPIAELAAVASARGIPCHVDACLGGFLLPWLRRLGRPVPPFDFAVPGVTSVSADLHKYGFAARGASVVLYRDESLRRYQFFAYTDWPGGLYASPSMTGSRPGGAIAAAWAALNFLGAEGYLAAAERIMATTDALKRGINEIPGLCILGEPVMSVFAFTAADVDTFALGDAMHARGWQLDTQHLPPALHLMVTPTHVPVVETFLADLRAAVAAVRAQGATPQSGVAAVYGMVGAMTDRAPARDLLVDLIGQILPPRA
jgi:glutamate/tyrosine decarboxylase-like PLP-dependent enzyme